MRGSDEQIWARSGKAAVDLRQVGEMPMFPYPGRGCGRPRVPTRRSKSITLTDREEQKQREVHGVPPDPEQHSTPFSRTTTFLFYDFETKKSSRAIPLGSCILSKQDSPDKHNSSEPIYQSSNINCEWQRRHYIILKKITSTNQGMLV